VVTESLGMWDTWVKVTGGGVNAQAEAVRMAVAKALNAYDNAYSATLRRAGYLINVIRYLFYIKNSLIWVAISDVT
jgi:ribosomal protein S9